MSVEHSVCKAQSLAAEGYKMLTFDISAAFDSVPAEVLAVQLENVLRTIEFSGDVD